ncbi:unnamed protein product [Nezara viridula]|uniref:UDP-glucuronosyltransferase n=1 Tax=Nezara viridula TaxID=85310 RepID=A0A9P0EBD1_NEZVI|nr:unnamed protein product [Nezara viridula]
MRFTFSVMKTALALVLLSLLTIKSEGSNILVLLPLPLYSHTNTFMPVFKELAIRGHNVTMVSPYPQKDSIPNWTEVIINGTAAEEKLGSAVKQMVGLNRYRFFSFIARVLSELMEVTFQEETLQNLIKAEDLQFDLVIIEPFVSEPLVAFGHKLNVPVVNIYPLAPSPWVSYLTGGEVSFSLMPNIRTEYTNQMTFLERLDNTLINLIELVTNYFYYIPRQEALMKKYMVYPGSDRLPDLLTMLQDISLTLLDYHMSVGYVEPLQPNQIPVGGLTLRTDGQLPKDLQDIMDESKSGVIYISFGSFLGSNQVPEEWLVALLEAMAKLDQTVLFKWNMDIPKKPKNVIVRKWYPQSSVLTHPNLRLFVTHSGLHSITEATYFGIPLVCMPFFTDQLYNSKFVQQAGYGLIVREENRTSENIYWAINTVLNDPRFKEKALERSKIVKDRPQTALESAVYWIEYVLRHKGAKHLKPARAQFNIYQALSIDVAACFLVVISLSLLIVYKSIRIVCCAICSRAPKVKKD